MYLHNLFTTTVRFARNKPSWSSSNMCVTQGFFFKKSPVDAHNSCPRRVTQDLRIGLQHEATLFCCSTPSHQLSFTSTAVAELLTPDFLSSRIEYVSQEILRDRFADLQSILLGLLVDNNEEKNKAICEANLTQLSPQTLCSEMFHI